VILTISKNNLKKADSIEGAGAFASDCNESVSVVRYRTLAQAEHAKRFINRVGCGSRCCGQHFVVKAPA
jgi:hypothetical protein